MNKYFEFTYKFLEKPGKEVTEHTVVGRILAEDEDTVKVKFYRVNGEAEVRVFQKCQGIVFNHLRI